MIQHPPQPSDAAALVNIHQGDAYNLMGTLPTESVDLIITSPPY